MPDTLTLEEFMSSPEGLNSICTLVCGEQEAILIDTPFLISDAKRLIEMIRASGKTLTAILVTHSHPDHWFTLSTLREAFPEVKLLAQRLVADDIEHVRAKKHQQWKPVFGDEIGEELIGPDPTDADALELDGERLELVYVPDGDCEHSTVIWMPSLSTLVTGDICSYGTHVYFAEHDAPKRAAYLATVERMAEFGARTVIPGHKAPGLGNDADAVIGWTANYLRRFEAMLSDAPSEQELERRIAVEWGDIPVEFAVSLNIAAALRGEYF